MMLLIIFIILSLLVFFNRTNERYEDVVYNDNHLLYQLEQRMPKYIHDPLDDYYRQGNSHTMYSPYRQYLGHQFEGL